MLQKPSCFSIVKGKEVMGIKGSAVHAALNKKRWLTSSQTWWSSFQLHPGLLVRHLGWEGTYIERLLAGNGHVWGHVDEWDTVGRTAWKCKSESKCVITSPLSAEVCWFPMCVPMNAPCWDWRAEVERGDTERARGSYDRSSIIDKGSVCGWNHFCRSTVLPLFFHNTVMH